MDGSHNEGESFFEHVDAHKEDDELDEQPDYGQRVGRQEGDPPPHIERVGVGRERGVGRDDVIRIAEEEHSGGDEVEGEAQEFGRHQDVLGVVHYFKFQMRVIVSRSNSVLSFDVRALVGPVLLVPSVQPVVAPPHTDVILLDRPFSTSLTASCKLLLRVEINIVQKLLNIFQLGTTLLLTRPQLLHPLLNQSFSIVPKGIITIDITLILPFLSITTLTLIETVSSSLCLLIVVRICFR
jgi:hypothetical protein